MHRSKLVLALIAIVMIGVLVPASQNATNAASGATLTIRKVNWEDKLISGSCFFLWTDGGGGTVGQFVAEKCDAGDENPNNGRITFSGLAANSYVLVETRAPKGYLLAKYKRVTLTAGQAKTVTVADPRGGHILSVFTKNTSGQSLTGACYSAFDTAGKLVAISCDAYDGFDGKTTISGLRPGSYILHQDVTLTGYLRASPTPISIASREQSRSITVTVQKVVASSQLRLLSRAPDGSPLTHACFNLWTDAGGGAQGSFIGSKCDYHDPSSDGLTTFDNVAPGAYVIVQSDTYPGYTRGLTRYAVKEAGRVKTVIFTNRLSSVSIQVTTQNTSNQPLPGTCLSIRKYSGTGPWGNHLSFACDSSDGAEDGVIVFTGMASGSYILVRENGEPHSTKNVSISAAFASTGGIKEVVMVIGNPASSSAASPTATVSSTPQASPQIATPEPSATETATVTETQTPSATPTESPTVEPTPTETVTSTPTVEASPVSG